MSSYPKKYYFISFWLLWAVFFVCGGCRQFPLSVSTNFHQFSSRTPNFRARTYFFWSVRAADISARQTCLRGRHVCPADISLRDRNASARQRRLCARQRCPCDRERCLCAKDMSVRGRRSLYGKEDPQKRDAYSGPKNTRLVIKTRPEEMG